MPRGKSRRRAVQIEYWEETEDSGGGAERGWNSLGTVRCRYERFQTFRGDIERMKLGGINSMPLVWIYMDLTPLTQKITTKMRLRDMDNGKVMNINAIQDMEGRSREIMISATEGSPT